MDATLPRTSVNKLIREVLPSGMRLTPDAREAVAECGLEFVQLVASVANGGDDEPASEGGVQRRCYATDSGTELRSAYLDGTRPQLSTGFMGDAPWVGVAAGATHDMPGQGETSSSYVAALTQKGTLYVL